MSEANVKLFKKAVQDVAEQAPFQKRQTNPNPRGNRFFPRPNPAERAAALYGDKKWEHDKFVLSEQGPKTTQELIRTYGCDIRKGPVPKDPSSCAKRSFFRQPAYSKIVTELMTLLLKTDSENEPEDDEEPTETAEASAAAMDAELSDFMSAICLKPNDAIIFDAMQDMEPPQAAPPTPELTDWAFNVFPPKNDATMAMNLVSLGILNELDFNKKPMQADAMEAETSPPAGNELFCFGQGHGPNGNVFFYQSANGAPMDIQEE